MPSPRVMILHVPGTSRDREAALACEMAGGRPEIVHINQLIAGERALMDAQMLVLPGGFSYGDALGAGRLWASDLDHRLGEALDAFVAAGKPVMGIGNGFQALVKAGYLPGPRAKQSATLTFNERGRFECRWVRLRPEPQSVCLFTEGIDEIFCPVAHGEGRLAVLDETVERALWDEGQVALTYVAPEDDDRGREGVEYPHNPDGSVDDIAGVCNRVGNVLGLMPHPEGHIYAQQHPRWSRGEGGSMGLQLFRNGVRAAARM